MKRKHFFPSEKNKQARWIAKAERDLEGRESKLPGDTWKRTSSGFFPTIGSGSYWAEFSLRQAMGQNFLLGGDMKVTADAFEWMREQLRKANDG